jgi:hypothetical protein
VQTPVVARSAERVPRTRGRRRPKSNSVATLVCSHRKDPIGTSGQTEDFLTYIETHSLDLDAVNHVFLFCSRPKHASLFPALSPVHRLQVQVAAGRTVRAFKRAFRYNTA